MKTSFLFFVADHLLVGQLCRNPKSDRSLLSCLKVTQCSTSEIGDAPLYNSCSLPIQVMTARTIAGLPRTTGTCPGKRKQSFRLKMQIGTVQRLRAQLNASDVPLEVMERKATSCHLTSSKSAWKSTPKCTWMCWRVVIPWCNQVTGGRPWVWQRDSAPTHRSKETQVVFRTSATTLYPSLTGPLLPRPEPAGLLRLVIRREHHQHDLPQHQSQPDRRRPPSFRRLWKRHAPSSGSVSRRWLRLKAATLNRCQLYYIIKLPELIFSIKVLK